MLHESPDILKKKTRTKKRNKGNSGRIDPSQEDEVDVQGAMRQAMDEEGKIDLEYASQAATVGVAYDL